MAPPITHRSRVSTPPRPTATTGAAPTARPTAPRPGRGTAVDRLERSAGTTSIREVLGSQPGTSIAALRSTVFLPGGVQLGTRGFGVDGQHSRSTAGVTAGTVQVLHTVAQRLCALDDNPFRASGCNAKVRAGLADHLERFLLEGRDAGGRDGQLALRSRSAAFALLVRLSQGMTQAERPLQRGVVDALLDAAEREPHPGLRRQMLLGLEQLPRRGLRAEQVQRRTTLAEALHPSAPPYQKWFGDDPAPQLQVRQYVQDEFWKKELAAYKKAGFALETVDAQHVVATKTLVDPKGEHPPVTARVELVEGDSGVFDAVNDRALHMILYTGHAQLGAVAKWSLEHGPRRASGDKVLGFFACRGKQWLGSVSRRYPDSQVLVSRQGTYGHDDRIVIQKMFEGIAQRAGWAAISRAAEAQDMWEPDNYLFPHDRRGLQHHDLDGDGRSAASGGRLDLLYSPSVPRGRGNAISFKPKAGPVDPARLDGAKLSDAVAWFNTEFYYWAEDQGRAALRLADRIVPDGWFNSNDPDELVRLSESRGPDGKPLLRLQVNAAYGHQSADALGMIVTFGAAQQLLARLQPDAPASERRMRALAMTGAYVSNLVEFSDVADLLLQNFAKRFGFPPTLTWPVVEKAVGSDHHHEASDKVIRYLEQGMRHAFLEVNPQRTSLEFRGYVAKAIDVLRRSDSEPARAAYEALVTGRVKVDTLDDLTRADFQRIRKELRGDGVVLKVEDYERLHHSRVRRAITSSIDGYMWDDRVYIAPGLKPENLAATLAHEINHVINASEEHYRSDRAILVEEYRAFYAEALVRGEKMTPARCKALKAEVIANYGLKDVGPDDVTDVPPGQFSFPADA